MSQRATGAIFIAFAYEPGYRYTLSIEVFDVANPPADASSKRYVLVDALEKLQR